MILASYFPIEYTIAVYMAIALPLCVLPTLTTRKPLAFGLFGSIMAMVLVCVFRYQLPFDFWAHANTLIMEPIVQGGWRQEPIDALQSLALHVGVPTMVCMSIDHWTERHTKKTW